MNKTAQREGDLVRVPEFTLMKTMGLESLRGSNYDVVVQNEILKEEDKIDFNTFAEQFFDQVLKNSAAGIGPKFNHHTQEK